MITTLRLIALTALMLAVGTARASDLVGFCAKIPRPAWAAFERHGASNDWFEVVEAGERVYAIAEPYQWQEVISYLIIGSERAVLFDTGNGIEAIGPVVAQLTDKPVLVINSHSHYDHIGGNHEFEQIASVGTAFSHRRSKGMSNAEVGAEASADALCKEPPGGADQASHHIKAYEITEELVDGQALDLGDRTLEVIHIPGHTDDSVALVERTAGYLWTGDSYYAGPIWLFADETNLPAYRASMARLAAMSADLTHLFPAHNTPREDPSVLPRVRDAFELIWSGAVTPDRIEGGVATFEFEGFSFKLREGYRDTFGAE